MLSERRTAISRRMFGKFSSVTIAPSILITKVRSRKRGIYWRMPRRSVGFTFALFGQNVPQRGEVFLGNDMSSHGRRLHNHLPVDKLSLNLRRQFLPEFLATALFVFQPGADLLLIKRQLRG